MKDFFGSYLSKLNSNDLKNIYDDNYFNKMADKKLIYKKIKNKYPIGIFSKPTYEYLIKKNLNKSKILDIGCGNGDFALAIASQNKGKVYGIDFTLKAIKNAQKQLKKSKLSNCQFSCINIQNYHPNEKFDYIILNDVTEHLSNQELIKLFQKIKNVINKNGEIIIHTPNGLALCNDTDSDWLQIIYKTYLRIFKKYLVFIKSAEQFYYEQTHINIKSFHQYKKLLSILGFSAKVIYDSEKKNILFDRLSSNMLIIAKDKNETKVL